MGYRAGAGSADARRTRLHFRADVLFTGRTVPGFQQHAGPARVAGGVAGAALSFEQDLAQVGLGGVSVPEPATITAAGKTTPTSPLVRNASAPATCTSTIAHAPELEHGGGAGENLGHKERVAASVAMQSCGVDADAGKPALARSTIILAGLALASPHTPILPTPERLAAS